MSDKSRPPSVRWPSKNGKASKGGDDGDDGLDEEKKSIGFSLTITPSHPHSLLGYDLERSETGIVTLGKLTMRAKDDELPQSWWFASTAIPLIAATIGPLANVLSIAALVSKWRVTLDNNGELPEGGDFSGVDIADPEWQLILNAFSLAFGFVGNFFLLCNFTKRVRYIIALPATILCWFLSMALLIGIVAAMYIYAPPIRPAETWSQGYWHAVIATVLYSIGAITLMINMLGYFLGKYPQHFDLDDDQRTLILQTMMFFFWLAGGAAVFSNVNGMSYANALYFCDVTVLTIGFGDIVPQNDTARGLVFLYSIFGIIFLGLMINSIRKFAESMSKDKVIKAHQEHERSMTFGRSVTSETELRDRLGLPPRRGSDPSRRKSSVTRLRSASVAEYGDLEIKGRTVTFHEHKQAQIRGGGRGGAGRKGTAEKPKMKKAMSRDEKIAARKTAKSEKHQRHDRRQKLLLLKEEKDRFDAMREIQENTKKFRQYYALSFSVLAFSVVWCLGALMFMLAEAREQDISYFQALYFCWVSLVTIGYGDYSPRSNAGRPFFVVWSLLAIPTMTILINDLGDTVVSAINRGTFTLAEWTVMPKVGVYHDFLEANPRIRSWLEKKKQEIDEKKRLESGFGLQDPDDQTTVDVDTKRKSSAALEKLADDNLTDHDLARKLSVAIKRVAHDLRHEPPLKYRYEDWVEFTRLIRFSASKGPEDMELAEEEQGIVEWDWIGEDSPMLTSATEAEWVLDRLCESLNRYSRKNARKLREESVNTMGVKKHSMKSFRPGNITHRFSREESLDPLEQEEEFEPESSGSSNNDLEKLASGEKDIEEPGWRDGDPFAPQSPDEPPLEQKSTGKQKEKAVEFEPDSAEALAERVKRMSKHKNSAAVDAWEEKLKMAREARKKVKEEKVESELAERDDPISPMSPDESQPEPKSTSKEKEKSPEIDPNSPAALAERVRRMSKAKRSNDRAAVKAWEEKLRKVREQSQSGKGKDA